MAQKSRGRGATWVLPITRPLDISPQMSGWRLLVGYLCRGFGDVHLGPLRRVRLGCHRSHVPDWPSFSRLRFRSQTPTGRSGSALSRGPDALIFTSRRRVSRPSTIDISSWLFPRSWCGTCSSTGSRAQRVRRSECDITALSHWLGLSNDRTLAPLAEIPQTGHTGHASQRVLVAP